MPNTKINTISAAIGYNAEMSQIAIVTDGKKPIFINRNDPEWNFFERLAMSHYFDQAKEIERQAVAMEATEKDLANALIEDGYGYYEPNA